MKEYIIYKITSPSGKIYIGYTGKKSIEKRYPSGPHKRQRKLYCSVMKYGWINHFKEIIDKTETLNEANEKEKDYIKFFNSFLEGLNCTEGGDGFDGKSSKGIPRTEEIKKKISKSSVGKILSRETKKLIGEKGKGRIPWNKGVKTGNYRPGWKLPEEAKEKLRLANIGKKYSDEVNKKKGRPQKKDIYSITI